MFGRLTWTFLDTERSVGVLGSGVVLQLERCGVVHKRLGALGHACAAVVEIGASLRRAHEPRSADGSRRRPDRPVVRRMTGGVIFSHESERVKEYYSSISFLRWAATGGSPSCPSSLWTPNGRKIGAIDPQP